MQPVPPSPSRHGPCAAAPRIGLREFDHAVPGASDALRALGLAVDATGLEKRLTELVKVRVSQMNGCAFCLQLHLGWARKAGVPDPQLDLLPVWREAGCFDARECAALEWAEALTRMERAPVDDDLHARAAAAFAPPELAALTAAVAAINAWNRIAGALRFALPGSEGTARTPLTD